MRDGFEAENFEIEECQYQMIWSSNIYWTVDTLLNDIPTQVANTIALECPEIKFVGLVLQERVEIYRDSYLGSSLLMFQRVGNSKTIKIYA